MFSSARVDGDEFLQAHDVVPFILGRNVWQVEGVTVGHDEVGVKGVVGYGAQHWMLNDGREMGNLNRVAIHSAVDPDAQLGVRATAP